MVYSEERGGIVDYLGSHEHLAVDIALRVDEAGGLCLRSGAQRFYEGPLAFNFPLLLSGIADVREWYDDEQQCFGIEVAVHNHRWGPLFGYSGRFNVAWLEDSASTVPLHVRPKRQESRE
jgi:hypothetical protein